MKDQKITNEEKLKNNLKEIRELLLIPAYNIDDDILKTAEEFLIDPDNFYDDEECQEEIKAARKAIININIEEVSYEIVRECSKYFDWRYRREYADTAMFYKMRLPVIWIWALAVNSLKDLKMIKKTKRGNDKKTKRRT